MDKIKWALVGCGGMGTRHLYGLRHLMDTPFCNVEIAALCDIRETSADMAAAEVESFTGKRPPVFTDVADMVQTIGDLQAVDVVVDPCFHHNVVCEALDLGLHVMVEKPLGITIKGCLQMIAAAERNDRILSVAENFRRDPSARLVHHLLAKGTIGTPYMGLFHSLGAHDQIFITPWRHLKERGGLMLDLGVHFTDMIRYQFGDIQEVYGDVRLATPFRRKPESISHSIEYYRSRHAEMEDVVEATAEDTSTAMFKMESGAVVSYIAGLGGHGGCGAEQILGENGVIHGFGSRGQRVRMKLGGEEEMSQEELVAANSDLELEPLAAHFFPEGVSGDNVDYQLLALEHFELAEAVLHGREIEVTGVEGLKDVAAVYAPFESSRAGRTVQMSEIESGELYEYQLEIDEAIGLA